MHKLNFTHALLNLLISWCSGLGYSYIAYSNKTVAVDW